MIFWRGMLAAGLLVLGGPGARAQGAEAQANTQPVDPQLADPEAAALRGVVVDAAGAPVAGADVTVSREGTPVAHTRTDAAGTFRFAGPAREYLVEVQANGFATLKSSAIPFAPGSTSRFALEGGSSSSSTEAVVTAPIRGGGPGLLAESPVHHAARTMPWEFGAFAQGGVGVTDQRGGFRFFQLGGHAGKVLTGEIGTGRLRGNFEYAVEVVPFWQAYTPRFSKISCNADPGAAPGTYTCSRPYTVGGTYTGVSVTPILLRWNFTHGERWMPWVQGAGGLLWTNHKFPAVGDTNPENLAANGLHGETSVWNFTPQFGVGAHYFLKPRRSLDFSANAVHISSASLGDRNPGVNASVQFAVGYTWWK